MPTTTPTILDQISAEKTKVSERLARLDTDRATVATQLTDLETTERVLTRVSKTPPARRPTSAAAAEAKASAASGGSGGLCFCGGSRCGSSSGRRLADARQHALGRLEIGQLSGDRCAVGIEACEPLADLRLLRADLVQYRRCCGRHGGLQWFQVDRDDRSCWRLTPQCGIFNSRMRQLTSLAADAICGSAPQPTQRLAAARQRNRCRSGCI